MKRLRENMMDVQKKKSGIFWDAEKKRPCKLMISFMISLTIIFVISGIISIFLSLHKIALKVTSNGECMGVVEFNDDVHEIPFGRGERTYLYDIFIGSTITVDIVWPFSISNPNPISVTVAIYDNGKLVQERTSINSSISMRLEYVVGDF